MYYVESCHGRVRLFDDNVIHFSAGFHTCKNGALFCGYVNCCLVELRPHDNNDVIYIVPFAL